MQSIWIFGKGELIVRSKSEMGHALKIMRATNPLPVGSLVLDPEEVDETGPSVVFEFENLEGLRVLISRLEIIERRMEAA